MPAQVDSALSGIFGQYFGLRDLSEGATQRVLGLNRAKLHVERGKRLIFERSHQGC
jgi:hypothetical protein